MQTQSTRVPRVCATCGTTFFCSPSDLKQPGRAQYCSRACKFAKSPRAQIVCAQCSTPFTVITSLAATAKYCSTTCYTASGRKHGGHVTHGESRNSGRSPEYLTWHGLKNRCLNPNDEHYPRYGARGITVCDAWRDSFEAFLADVGRRPSPQHTIDRFPDQNGNYEPGNVRWATHREQQQNLITNRLVTFNGITLCAREWERTAGLPKGLLLQRLKAGWSVERALTTPSRGKFWKQR